jgi:hypothetical protein
LVDDQVSGDGIIMVIFKEIGDGSSDRVVEAKIKNELPSDVTQTNALIRIHVQTIGNPHHCVQLPDTRTFSVKVTFDSQSGQIQGKLLRQFWVII